MNKRKPSRTGFTKYAPFTLSAFISISILVCIGTFMLFLSWRKWPDLVVDFGGELYVPWQLMHGAVYNKDIIAGFGPLSYYINTFLFWVFGVNWMVIAVFNILLIIVLTCILYLFFLKTTDRVTATITGAVFLGLFAFAQYTGTGNYNFVTPYSHHLTHGVILSFVTLFLFRSYVQTRQTRYIITIGISLGLVFLTKFEVFIALFAAITFGLLFIHYLEKTPIHDIVKRSVMFLAGFFIPSFVLISFLSQRSSLREAFSSVLVQYQMLSNTSSISNVFYQKVSGVHSPLANLGKVLIVAGWYLVVIITVILFVWLISRIPREKTRKVVFFMILTSIYLLVPYVVLSLPVFEIFRALPLLLFILGIYLFIHLLRIQRTSRHQRDQLLSLLVMTIFAFGLLLKVILNTGIHHYGFALALPATLLCVMVFVYNIPNMWGKFHRELFFMRCCMISLVMIILLTHIYYSYWIYGKKLFPVTSGHETILAYDPDFTPQGVYYQAALDDILGLMNEDETFAVLPEGIMLNYLARRRNPSPYLSFIPFVIEQHGEDTMLEGLINSDPDYIVLLERDVREFGYEKFGKDSGAKIMKWVNDNYSTVSRIGNSRITEGNPWITIKKRGE
jgi:4-amino-4-deoxy-L-arabinose transferase-like glycosyltransferase